MKSGHPPEQDFDTYLDGELPEAELESLLAHVRACDSCRQLLEERRAFAGLIRSSKPDLRASPSLREKVSEILAVADPKPAKASRHTLIRWKPILAYAAALFVIAAISLIWISWRKETRAANFVTMAIAVHQRSLNGSVPIQLKTASARELTTWFGAKLPFAFRLPTYQDDTGDTSKYEMVGGSVTPFHRRNAAYVVYRLQTHLISLLVTSSDQAVAYGGDKTVAKNLVFHSQRKDGFQVITWSVHNLTYALVSDVKVPARQSCVVCHSDPEGTKLLQHL